MTALKKLQLFVNRVAGLCWLHLTSPAPGRQRRRSPLLSSTLTETA